MTRKVALITGGSRGLGQSTALHLSKENVGVVITYQSKAKEAEKIVEEINNSGGCAVALHLDVTDVASFSCFRDTLITVLKENFKAEKFDFLVNNAGYGVFTPFENTTKEELDAMYAVHVKGPFFLTQSLAELMNDGEGF